MSWFQNKKVFITGGSSGIGRCLALDLARAGAHVSIAARGQAKLDAVLAELREAGSGTFHAISLDVSDREAVNAAAAEVMEALGGIDIVIPNAGITHPGYIEDIPAEVFDSMMDVNYFGTVNVIRAFLPTLREQRSGHICSVCSTLGFLPAFGYSAYCPSKFAITGFSECLRQEVLLDGVQVHVVYPPDTDTPQHEGEKELLPPETVMLSEGWSSFLQPEEVSQEVLNGIRRGKTHIVPGGMNKFLFFMQRHFPAIVVFFTNHDLRSFAKKKQKAQ